MNEWGLCEARPGASRRALLGGALALGLAAWAGRSALAQVSLGKAGDERILVTLFLRGGMDGLSFLVPHGDDDYHRARPTIGLGTPGKGAGKVVDLDGFFGLHPALAKLQPFYADGRLAGLHAVGSQDQTRSHFEAMATMERGAASDPATLPSGWMARCLADRPPRDASPLRAVAFGAVLPDILRGATDVSVIHDLAEVRLQGSPAFQSALARLYGSGDSPVLRAGQETLAVLDKLERLDPKTYRPENGAHYPDSALGQGLKQTALLAKAGVGLEAAALDRGGWDTHVTQGGATGWLAAQLTDVGDSLAAFAADLGPHLDRVTVVVLTEFGRRVAENSGLGTDHGRASSWLLLGGGVRGAKVYARWPGLAPEKLEAPGDVPVTTDYRDVLAEVVAARFGGPEVAQRLFPGAPGTRFGLIA